MKNMMKLMIMFMVAGFATLGMAEDKLTTYVVGMKGVT